MKRLLPPLIAVLAGCPQGEGAPAQVCDGGHEAFVREALPLVLGRDARSATELAVLVDLAESSGRDALVRALATGEEARVHWRETLFDLLRVNRTGLRANPGCFEARAAAPGPELGAFLRDHGPTEPYGEPFTFADLVDSALRLDDLSPLHRAMLFAMLPVDKTPVNLAEAESMSREYVVLLEQAWLNRSLACLPCHNSEWSITGHRDPELDRTWEIPGLYEEAVFGRSEGRKAAELGVFFRRVGVVDGVELIWGLPEGVPQGIGVRPWGWAEACGSFIPEEAVPPDPFGEPGWFLGEPEGNPSPWPVERGLHEGFDLLREQRPDPVTAPDAFAWLVSAHLAEQVWQLAVGSPLTVAHNFPRNRPQRDLLWSLTEAYVEGGYSLVELLAAVTAEPAFNPAPPDRCESSTPWALPPLLDPWTVDDADAPRDNGAPDRVARRPLRTTVRSVLSALRWGEAVTWFDDDSSPGALELQSMGLFLKDSAPGFRGTDFQGALAWEEAVAGCRPPSFADPPGEDFVDALVAAAGGRSFGEAAAALKDRLLADPSFEAEERGLLEAVAGRGFDEPFRPEDEEGLRALCGLWLMTPDTLLSGNPTTDRAEGRSFFAGSYRQACEALDEALAVDLSCGEDTASISP